MAKDKPASKYSMMDMYENDKRQNSGTSRDIAEFTPEESFITFDEKFEEKVNTYNKNITNLDPEYTSVIPYTKILVRLFLRPMQKDENGFILPQERMLRVPTTAGVGDYAHIPDPYPFANKAIVVATPETSSFTPGDVVLLTHNQTGVVNKGQDGMVVVPNAFIHPDLSSDLEMPLDPSKRTYGYVWVNSQDINGFLSKAKK